MRLKPGTQLSKNFIYGEFANASVHPDMTTVRADYLLMYLVPWLQHIRNNYSNPIAITSFVRSVEHNKSVGGVPNSTHVKGMALDFILLHLAGDSLFEREKLFELVGNLHADIRYCVYKPNQRDHWFCHIDCGKIIEPEVYPEWKELQV